jgi:iron-sulfur cluster insertion protein
MNDMTTAMPDPLIFTESAANKVKALIEEEGNEELKLRVFVTGGGCSGLHYGFTFDEVANEDDTVMSKNGVSLLIDPMSYQYLVGAEIDYTEGLEGAQFVIKNPNATSTCLEERRRRIARGASAPLRFFRRRIPRPGLAARALRSRR